MKRTIFITGASRGLGLEFVKQYAEEGHQILACCRDPAKAIELQDLTSTYPNISIYQLDVTDKTSINQLAAALSGKEIDILINNAGIMGKDDPNLSSLEAANLMEVFQTNTVSPLLIVQAFYNHLLAGNNKLIVAISSELGSIAKNTSGGRYAYRISKAALNMAMKNVAIEAAKDSVRILTLHPGWVQTDMGGKEAPLTADMSIAGMRKVIANASQLTSGGFYNYDGKELAW